MNSSKIFYFLAIGILAVASCTSPLYKPVQEQAEITGVPLDSLLEGRRLYINKCGSCHNLYLPEYYTSKEWHKTIPEMQEKAKIDDRSVALISSYLLANCKKQ